MGQQVSQCANQNQVCNLPQKTPQNVIYGANGQYYFRTFNGQPSVLCNDQSFGGDPSPGHEKQCYRRNVPQVTFNPDGTPNGYTKCAEDGGICQPGYPANILYGANGNYVSGFTTANHPVTCNTTVFGDPSPGTPKSCYVKVLNTQGWPNSLKNPTNPNVPQTSTTQSYSNPPSVGNLWNVFAANRGYVNNKTQTNSSVSSPPSVGNLWNVFAANRGNRTQTPVPATASTSHFGTSSFNNAPSTSHFTTPIAQQYAPIIQQYIQPPFTPLPMQTSTNTQNAQNAQNAQNIPISNAILLEVQTDDSGDEALFYGWNGYDAPGFDINNMPITVSSEEECATNCVNQGCNLYSYDSSNNSCWLKQLPAKQNINTKFFTSINPAQSD